MLLNFCFALIASANVCQQDVTVTTANLPEVSACREIHGSLTVNGMSPKAIHLAASTVRGDLVFDGYAGTVDSDIEILYGEVAIRNQAEEFRFNSIHRVYVDTVRVYNATSAPDLSGFRILKTLEMVDSAAPNLFAIAGRDMQAITLENCPNLTSLALAELQSVQDLRIAATGLDLASALPPSLAVENDLTIVGYKHECLTIAFARIGGHFTLASSAAVKHVRFTNIDFLNYDVVDIDNPNLVDVKFRGNL